MFTMAKNILNPITIISNPASSVIRISFCITTSCLHRRDFH
jgi:hypothetical protein